MTKNRYEQLSGELVEKMIEIENLKAKVKGIKDEIKILVDTLSAMDENQTIL